MPFSAGIQPLIAFLIACSKRLYNNCYISSWLGNYTGGQRLMPMIASFNTLRENPIIFYRALGLAMLNHIF